MHPDRSIRPQSREAPGVECVGAVSGSATSVTCIAGFACIAFALACGGTSSARLMPIEWSSYAMPATRGNVLIALDSLGVGASRTPRGTASTSADTVTVKIRQADERTVAITLEVRDGQPGESDIRPIAATAGEPTTSSDAVRTAIVAQVVQPAREWLARHRVGGR